MKYKAVIFDLDGTIVDTEHLWQKATERLIRSYGIDYNDDVKANFLHKIWGRALPESCAVIKDFFNIDKSVEDLMKQKSDYGVSSVNFVGKPNPAIYIHAARQIEVDPQECISIEDSPFGIQAAKNVGMLGVGINTSRDRSELKEAMLLLMVMMILILID